jgi:hypothetical protein
MFLLAQFRETRAYPLLVRIFSAPAEISHDLTGDIAAIYLGRILASVSDGEDDLIEPFLIRSEQIEEAFAAGRDAAMQDLKNANPLISDAESEMSWCRA